jgi:tagatose kinase
MKSILTIGEILVEIIATDKGNGFLEPANLVGPFPSGAPAIFIDQAAKFGQPAAILGCVGDDDFGRVNLNRLRRDGVDVEGVRIDPETATGSAFVRYRPDGSRAFVYNIKYSASGNIALDSAARAVLDRSDHLHVMGTALFSPSIVEVVFSAAESIAGHGGTISFDPNLRPEILNLPGLREACDTLFRRCDVFCRAASNSISSRTQKKRKPQSRKFLVKASARLFINAELTAPAISTGRRSSPSRGSRLRKSIRRELATPSARRS